MKNLILLLSIVILSSCSKGYDKDVCECNMITYEIVEVITNEGVTSSISIIDETPVFCQKEITKSPIEGNIYFDVVCTK